MAEEIPNNVIHLFPGIEQPVESDDEVVEAINGHLINLGTLSLEALITLERQCCERYQDAQLEMLIVQEVLGKRMRGEDLS